MRLDQAVELAKKFLIHNDLDYYFFRTKNNQWKYARKRTNGVSYTPRELVELVLKG
jgi:hypothetical protein